jgi:hypothetical protein
MGIRGLSKFVHNRYLKPLDTKSVKDAHILVDGPNFAYFVITLLDSKAVNSPYHEFVSTLDKLLDSLVSLEPAAITFYFDGACPQDKVAVRFNRASDKIDQPELRVCHAVPFTSIYLREHRPEVGVQLVAGEAEDAIVSDILRAQRRIGTKQFDREIVDSEQCPRRMLVLSNDSDFFRYTGLGGKMLDVRILPLSKCEFLEPAALKSVKLTPSLSHAIYPQARLPARTLDMQNLFPEYILDKTLDFLNNLLGHQDFVATLPVYYEDRSMPPCWLAGTLYRSYAYTVLIRRHGTLEMQKLRHVREAYRIGDEYSMALIDIRLDDLTNYSYENSLEPFLSAGYSGLVDAVIYEVQNNPGPAFGKPNDSATICGLKRHLTAVFGAARHPGEATSENRSDYGEIKIPKYYSLETRQLHAQIMACMYSLMLLESALKRQFLPDRLLPMCTLNTNANLLQYWIDRETDAMAMLDEDLENLTISLAPESL